MQNDAGTSCLDKTNANLIRIQRRNYDRNQLAM